jgi:acetyl-CoA carboxylase carboxyl transferase subunit beta
VVAAQHAWLSALQPEGAAAILHRTVERAAEIAERQGVGTARLLSERVVDRVVDERPDAAEEPEAFLHRLATIVEADLADLAERLPATRMAERRRRYRHLGFHAHVPGTAVSGEPTPEVTRSQPEETHEP